jgi:hypothetical protein
MSGLLDGKLFVKITELTPATDFAGADEFVFVQDGTTLKLTGQSIADSVTAIGNLASKGYVDTLVDSVVDSAPGTLNTLRELAFALNDDENFASHIVATVNGKLASTDFATYFNSEFAAKNTYHLAEGSNLYFTNERAKASIFDADDIINFNNGGQVGNAQHVHQNILGNAIDLYATSDLDWVQLNYDDRNFVWADATSVGLSVGTSAWIFDENYFQLPDGGDIIDINGNSVLRPSDPSFNTVTLTGPITEATQAVTKDYVDTTTSAITIYDTDGLPEGSINKYFTTTRARDSFSAGNGITITNGRVSSSIVSSDNEVIISNANGHGGTGYAGMLTLTNTGATNGSKFIRINNTGALEIINSAYSATVFAITDGGQTQLGAGGLRFNDGTVMTTASNGGGGSTYTLPTASTSVLGGVKVDGTTITVDGNGVIHGSSTYTLPTASTSVLGGVKVDGTSITINNGVISSAGSAFSRATVATTTASLNANASATATVTAAKGYVLYSIQVSAAAWVTVYSSTAARTADSARSISTDPTLGSGVLAEVITTGAATQLFTPGIFGFSSESSPNSNVQLKITNNGATATPITVTLTYLPLES